MRIALLFALALICTAFASDYCSYECAYVRSVLYDSALITYNNSEFYVKTTDTNCISRPNTTPATDPCWNMDCAKKCANGTACMSSCEKDLQKCCLISALMFANSTDAACLATCTQPCKSKCKEYEDRGPYCRCEIATGNWTLEAYMVTGDVLYAGKPLNEYVILPSGVSISTGVQSSMGLKSGSCTVKIGSNENVSFAEGYGRHNAIVLDKPAPKYEELLYSQSCNGTGGQADAYVVFRNSSIPGVRIAEESNCTGYVLEALPNGSLSFSTSCKLYTSCRVVIPEGTKGILSQDCTISLYNPPEPKEKSCASMIAFGGLLLSLLYSRGRP
jgi:hypothetical protein